MNKTCGLPAIVDGKSKILILGSFPSPLSLQQQEYYGNPRNHFWTIMAELLREPLPTDYESKKRMLSKHRVALWDVLSSCYRKGAADARIEDPEINELESFVREHRQLKAVFFNGRAAEKIFKLHYEEFSLPCAYLPSTSPAHALHWGEKILDWKKILQYLAK